MPEKVPSATAPRSLRAGIFDAALATLPPGNGVTSAISFRDYARQAGIDARRATPEYISVDSYDRLSVALRRSSAMVFRLGEADGTGTQFALVRIEEQLSDFFLYDQDAFAATEVETYLPEASLRALFPFALVEQAAETNLVNYAFASGVLAEALDLDEPPPVPACGRGRYSFDFRPHSSLPDVLHHRTGQVEVDAMFVGRQAGVLKLFVVEAKVGSVFGSLARHKLAYPCLAFRHRVPPDMAIIPVYLKIGVDMDGITFNVAALAPFGRTEFPLDVMGIERTRRLKVPSYTM